MRQLHGSVSRQDRIPGLILELRRRLAVEKGQPLAQKAIFSVVNNRRLFHSMLRAGSLMQKPLQKDGFIRHLPFFLSEMTEFRSLPAIAETPFRDTFKKIQQPACQREDCVLCGLPDRLRLSRDGRIAGEDTEQSRASRSCFPKARPVAARLARYSGAYEVAAQNANDNIKALLADDVTYVVSACPTCTAALKQEFISTFESLGQTGSLPRARELADKVIDFSSLVKKLVDEGRLKFKEGHQLGKITYHDSCHLKRTLHASQPPRDLLTQAGYEIAEMYEADMCCGMGGLVFFEASGNFGAYSRAQAD